MIDAIQALSPSGGALASPTPGQADLQHLSNRFNSMMAAEPDPGRFTEQHLQQGGSAVSAFVGAQETMIRQTFDNVHAFMADAPRMGMQEMMVRQMDVQYQVALTSMQFQSAVFIAQSGKSGLSTLMKNQ